MGVDIQDLAEDPSNLRCASADTNRRNPTVSKMIENTAEKDLRSFCQELSSYGGVFTFNQFPTNQCIDNICFSIHNN